MVLNIKYLFILSFTLLLAQLKANDNQIFFTDKYDVNYFSNTTIQNTEIYFGSDLFPFLSDGNKKEVINFIDSFLANEKYIQTDTLRFIAPNMLSFSISELDAIKCAPFSVLWKEKYSLEFKELLFKHINTLDFNSVAPTAENMIFKTMIENEMSRFYNSGNSVNNIKLAFVIPEKLSQNDFIKVSTHQNTKRYNGSESQLNTTEIFSNNSLSNSEIYFYYPSLNRQTFIRNCLSLSIVESLYKDIISFENKYYINQIITRFKINATNGNIDDFKINLTKTAFTEYEFKILAQNAMKDIISICNKNLFYYSYDDIKKLTSYLEEYTFEDFEKEISIINNREKYFLEISSDSKIKYKEEKLLTFNKMEFDNKLNFKVNSVQFENKADRIYISKLVLFLKVNENFSLGISSTAKPSEYLFIDKFKREALTAQYNEYGYVISKKKKLALYRSLNIFNELISAGISYKRLKCSGIESKKAQVEFYLFIQK